MGEEIQKCPKCASPIRASIPDVGIQFECATIVYGDSHIEALPCVMRQRDQLATELQTIRTASAALVERVHSAEAVLTDPHALWANWLRGTVKLPAGIGDIRQAEARVNRLQAVGDKMAAHIDGEARLWGLESSEFGDEWRAAKGHP